MKQGGSGRRHGRDGIEGFLAGQFHVIADPFEHGGDEGIERANDSRYGLNTPTPKPSQSSGAYPSARRRACRSTATPRP
jgi:hypothetical protein